MQVIERSIVLNSLEEIEGLRHKILSIDNEILIRFVVEKICNGKFFCSINTIKGLPDDIYPVFPDITTIRKLRNDNKFRVALVIPTGLGASVGGHAGDGGGTARLMASVCDQLITHPNVVNASDINEMTENTLYVEGYLLSQYLLGNIGLQEVRQNRVLVVIDGSASSIYIDAAINSVNAARVTYGFNCPEVVVLKKPFTMKTGWSNGGRAAGIVFSSNHSSSIAYVGAKPFQTKITSHIFFKILTRKYIDKDFTELSQRMNNDSTSKNELYGTNTTRLRISLTLF